MSVCLSVCLCICIVHASCICSGHTSCGAFPVPSRHGCCLCAAFRLGPFFAGWLEVRPPVDVISGLIWRPKSNQTQTFRIIFGRMYERKRRFWDVSVEFVPTAVGQSKAVRHDGPVLFRVNEREDFRVVWQAGFKPDPLQCHGYPFVVLACHALPRPTSPSRARPRLPNPAGPCPAIPSPACRALPSHAGPHHALPSRALPRQPCHAVPNPTAPYHALPCRATPRQPCLAMPDLTPPCLASRALTYRAQPYRAQPCHATCH
jgi:hypothetical protein